MPAARRIFCGRRTRVVSSPARPDVRRRPRGRPHLRDGERRRLPALRQRLRQRRAVVVAHEAELVAAEEPAERLDRPGAAARVQELEVEGDGGQERHRAALRAPASPGRPPALPHSLLWDRVLDLFVERGLPAQHVEPLHRGDQVPDVFLCPLGVPAAVVAQVVQGRSVRQRGERALVGDQGQQLDGDPVDEVAQPALPGPLGVEERAAGNGGSVRGRNFVGWP